MKFFNTYSRKKEEFTPHRKGHVSLYTCGPTVYNYAHIGNFRAYLFEDLLRRYLSFRGYHVKHVMNLTDVDDKTIKGSRADNVSLSQFTEKYKQAFFHDLSTLNIERAEIYPAATDNIPEMISLVQSLLDRGYAYKAEDGSIYFRIEKYVEYGKLAHINVDDLKSGARVKHDEYEKQHLADFALWKAWDENDGDVYWESPFGRGRPGWHIECSAMSVKYLGLPIDIHTGGVDNIFPHHENEIAQTTCGLGKSFVNYWMHCEHLLVNGRKMSKSLGNFYTLRDVLEKGYEGKAIRYLLISAHYRQQLNFTFEALDAARSSVERLSDFMSRMKESSGKGKPSRKIEQFTEKTQKLFIEYMDDDLNISPALGVIFDFMRDANKMELTPADAAHIASFMESLDTVIGVLSHHEEEVPIEIMDLVKKREDARKNKDFAQSDQLRDHILQKGYIVEDVARGSRVRKA